MHTPLSYRSPGRFKTSPTVFCDSLILCQAADAQEIFGIERLGPWGMGAAKSSVASQVSLPPPLNWASPAASSPLCPFLKMYVAADAQEIIRSELLEPLGKGAANSSDDGQVCPPQLNRASPAAYRPSLPLTNVAPGCRCAGDHQERAAGASGQQRGEGRGGGSWYNTCLQYTGCNEKGMFVVSDYLQI